MAAGAPQYTQWFNAADKDRNGYLTSKELKKALKSKGYKTKRKEFKTMFAKMDRDHDKKITLNEYLIAMGQVRQACHNEASVRAAFKRADKNRDGSLTTGELSIILQQLEGHKFSSAEVSKIMKEMDKDRSGKVTYKEFTAYFRKHNGLDSDYDSSDSD